MEQPEWKRTGTDRRIAGAKIFQIVAQLFRLFGRLGL